MFKKYKNQFNEFLKIIIRLIITTECNYHIMKEESSKLNQ